ncbi:MAG: hypothetical protein ACOYVD_01180 [Bacillota bacterium]
MLTAEYLSRLLEGINEHLNTPNNPNNNQPNKNKQERSGCTLTPAQVLIILGILGGVLFVDSIQVTKDQLINIVLQGSLQRPTKADKVLEEMGSMSFDQVMQALIKKYS